MTTPFEKILNSKSGLFHTPDSWNDLMDWIELHPATDRPALITAAGMAWNLALEASAQSLVTDRPSHELKQEVAGREFV